MKIEERKIRKIMPNELLISVEACGICGTDIHIFDGSANSTPPVILGHEYTGTVEDVGKSVTRFRIGDRVVVDPNITCGQCYYCRRGQSNLCENLTALGVHIDGGFAEYSVVPEIQLYRLPDNISFEWGCFIEPLSCSIHGVDLIDIKMGDTVVILGAGAVGLMIMQLAHLSGAGKIIVIEPIKKRREIARMLKADIVIDPTEENVRDITMKNSYDGADVVMECAGSPQTARLAFDLVRRGGRIMFFGVCDRNVKISISPQEIYFKELTIKGSYINPNTFSKAIELLSLNRVDLSKFDIIKFPLEELPKAFKYHKECKTIKTLIIPKA